MRFYARGLLDYGIPEQNNPVRTLPNIIPQHGARPPVLADGVNRYGLLDGYRRDDLLLPLSYPSARSQAVPPVASARAAPDNQFAQTEMSEQEWENKVWGKGASTKWQMSSQAWLPLYTRLFTDPAVFDKFNKEARQVYNKSIQTGQEDAIIRVYETPEGIKSMIVPGQQMPPPALGVVPPTFDTKLGKLLFEFHPHPKGSPRPSPTDLGTSLNAGVPSLFWQKKDGSNDFDPIWYQGRPLR